MHITKHSTVASLLLALGVVACNNDSLTNLNQNPNNPTSAPPGPVFTQAARLSASRFIKFISALRNFSPIGMLSR